MNAVAATPEAKRSEYLRGIAASVPTRAIDRNKARHAVLDAAFTEIAHPQSWKNPINVVMTFHESDGVGVGIYCDAIEYFTGTKPELFIVEQELDQHGKQINSYRIVSEGYFLGGAGG
ncbi:hypothetical protein LP414_27570 [Polaromonas sp. P1(28)-13]|nr:hypothetical protein LP414_27570 [Polaromonas sp. P1(28)-13]